MTSWIRFENAAKTGFGTLDGDTITVHEGDMFAGANPPSETLPLSAVKVLQPTTPGPMLALWNNSHALPAKLTVAGPPRVADTDDGTVCGSTGKFEGSPY